jgi:AbrB family looped-hinge helix DNA binding protein
MSEVIVSSKFEMLVPREARKALGLKRGDKVQILVQGTCMILRRKSTSRKHSKG